MNRQFVKSPKCFGTAQSHAPKAWLYFSHLIGSIRKTEVAFGLDRKWGTFDFNWGWRRPIFLRIFSPIFNLRHIFWSFVWMTLLTCINKMFSWEKEKELSSPIPNLNYHFIPGYNNFRPKDKSYWKFNITCISDNILSNLQHRHFKLNFLTTFNLFNKILSFGLASWEKFGWFMRPWSHFLLVGFITTGILH